MTTKDKTEDYLPVPVLVFVFYTIVYFVLSFVFAEMGGRPANRLCAFCNVWEGKGKDKT
jgi:hypothetical protein